MELFKAMGVRCKILYHTLRAHRLSHIEVQSERAGAGALEERAGYQAAIDGGPQSGTCRCDAPPMSTDMEYDQPVFMLIIERAAFWQRNKRGEVLLNLLEHHGEYFGRQFVDRLKGVAIPSDGSS